MEFAYNTSLPIYKNRLEIIETIRSYQVIIIAGETGCGKTTHVPLMCMEAFGILNTGRIVCTQPRRIAAISLARYVSTLVPDAPEAIGYKIRFRDAIRPETRISFVTDGIVLAETTSDPLLKRYDCIIIDEAHERSINIDFLLGYMRWLLPKRPELKLIISSATLDTSLFSVKFNHAPVISITGRLFPVEIRYEPVIALWQGVAMRLYVDGVVHAVMTILDEKEPGDVLAFLPTVDDIKECWNILFAKTKKRDICLLQLFGRMAPEEQEKIFSRSDKRRIVLATNIAETSITVPDIRFVIDTGLSRSVGFDSRAGINRMPVSRISKASADQRAGRCGRVRNGTCIRLYSQQDYESRPRFTLPEIRRVNCAGVLLRMANLGIGGPRHFPFLQPPSPASINAGFSQLRFLGAFDMKGKLTKLGRAMARLPLDPAVARMLLFARDHGAFSEVAVIASALSIDALWAQEAPPKTAIAPELAAKGFASDFMTFVSLWQSLPRGSNGAFSRKLLSGFCVDTGLSLQPVKEWTDVHRQLTRICTGLHPINQAGAGSYEQIHKALLAAFALNCAQRESNGLYRTGRTHDIMVSPGSKLRKDCHPWLLFHEIVETKRSFGRIAAVIKPQWIEELFPAQCRTTYENPRFDPDTGSVQCLRSVNFNGLFIVEDQVVDYGKARPSEAHEIFIEEALIKEQTRSDFNFLRYNRRLRDAVDLAQRKLRNSSLYRGDHAMAEFYNHRLQGIVCDEQLRKLIRHKGDRFLVLSEEDILTGPWPKELSGYPDSTMVAGSCLSITYQHRVGDELDGATITVPYKVFRAVPFSYWQWLLPVFWRSRLKEALALIGKQDVFEDDCDKILAMLEPGKGGFIDQLTVSVEKMYGTILSGNLKTQVMLQDYLWIRVCVIDDVGKVLDSFRSSTHPALLPLHLSGLRPDVFSQWFGEWEEENISKFGRPVFKEVRPKPPDQIVPFWGITALSEKKGIVSTRVFLSSSAAFASHRHGVKALLDRVLAETMAWTWRDFSASLKFPVELDDIIDKKEYVGLIERLFNEIVLELDYDLPVDSKAFDQVINTCAGRIDHAPETARKLVTETLLEYKTCAQILHKFFLPSTCPVSAMPRKEELEKDLHEYMELLYNPRPPLKRISAIPRFLRAFGFRVQFASNKPVRYDLQVKTVNDLQELLVSMRSLPGAGFPHIMKILDEFELMIEEYRVFLFTNGQVPAAFPVSEQRINRAREEALRTMEHGRDFAQTI